MSEEKLIIMGKSKKRSHSRDKENEKLWKKLKGLQDLIESRLPALQPPQPLKERGYNDNEIASEDSGKNEEP